MGCGKCAWEEGMLATDVEYRGVVSGSIEGMNEWSLWVLVCVVGVRSGLG